MRHKQTLWDKIIGRMVVEEHNARSTPYSRRDWIVIQDWRYVTPLRRLARKLHLDKSTWMRTLVKEKVIKTS